MSAARSDDETQQDHENDELFGRMNDPSAAAFIKGACGDSMEFYLVIHKERISDIRYYCEGCSNTRASARAVARRALGRSIDEALTISAGELIRSGECDPAAGRHCAILAVSTFYRAVADYLLMP
jgi:nitrogen fixation NifU-like protein